MDKFLLKTCEKGLNVQTANQKAAELTKKRKSSCNIQNEIQIPSADLTADDNDVVNATSSNIKKQKFRQIWLQKFNWMIEKTGPKNVAAPYCKYCQTFLANNYTLFVRHENSNMHKKLIKSLEKQPLINNIEEKQNFEKKYDKIKTAELQIIMFLISHNLPFSLVTGLIALIKVVAPDSEIAKGLKCGKTKATEITNTLFFDEGLGEISKILREQKFSLIIDETTDVSVNKSLVIVVRYFDYIVRKVRDRFFALIQLDNSDSKTIYNAIVDYFKKLNIPLQNLIGFASDNASVMMGNKSGVKTLIKNNQPNLYVMGCICHSLHLCSASASKKLPKNLECLARNIYSFFAHSSKRITALREFQEYFSVKVHKILKVSSTRWLSLENVLTRILEQWVPLQHFFLSYGFENNVDLAQSICSELNDINKTYFYFLVYILNLTNKINIEFQAEAPRMYKLLPTIKTYFKTIIQNFIKSEYYEAVINNEVGFENEHIFLNIDQVYLGANALLLLNKSVSEDDANIIRFNCRAYYIEICKQILNRIKFDDKVLIEMQGINPSNMSKSLVPLISLFPNLVDSDGVEPLDEEWRCLLNQEFVDRNLDFEDFWDKIFALKNALNEYMFPKISNFIGTIIAFPHSSATAERKFSEVALIKDKKRNSLITSTVNAILMSKELLNNKYAEKWVPSKNLILKYKKTCKA